MLHFFNWTADWVVTICPRTHTDTYTYRQFNAVLYNVCMNCVCVSLMCFFRMTLVFIAVYCVVSSFMPLNIVFTFTSSVVHLFLLGNEIQFCFWWLAKNVAGFKNGDAVGLTDSSHKIHEFLSTEPIEASYDWVSIWLSHIHTNHDKYGKKFSQSNWN